MLSRACATATRANARATRNTVSATFWRLVRDTRIRGLSISRSPMCERSGSCTRCSTRSYSSFVNAWPNQKLCNSETPNFCRVGRRFEGQLRLCLISRSNNRSVFAEVREDFASVIPVMRSRVEFGPVVASAREEATGGSKNFVPRSLFRKRASN